MGITYAGRSGAFAHQAAVALYGEGGAEGVASFDAALDAARSGAALAAVVPVFNTTAGPVPGVIAAVVERQLRILGATWLPVRLHLLGVPSAQLSDVVRVRSHPMALAQCKAFLRAHKLTSVPGPNTATCAAQVARAGDPRCAALASEQAAQELGLQVLAANVQDAVENATLFFAVGVGAGAVGDQAATAWLLRGAAPRDALLAFDVERTRQLVILRGDATHSRALLTRSLGAAAMEAELGTFAWPPAPAALSRS